MKKKVICVDVDGTVTDTCSLWFEWCHRNYKTFNKDLYEEHLHDRGKLDYHLGAYFSDPREGVNDICDFWMQYDLYDKSSVYRHAYRVLKKYHNMGHDIVFSSYSIEHNHHAKSKVDFLLKAFDFIQPHEFVFIQTHNKGSMERSIDFFVDDRNNFCNQFSDKVHVFRLETPYIQHERLDKHVEKVVNWLAIEQRIDEILKQEDI